VLYKYITTTITIDSGAVICSNKYYLIFTHTNKKKNFKNAEICGNMPKELGQSYEHGSFPFRVYQLRKCICECKKTALTVKTSTGIKSVQDEKQLGA